jgi:adenylate cyclase
LSTAGPGSTDLNEAYTRAWELCEKVGEAPQRFQTLFILVHHHANAGEMQRTLKIAEQLAQVAESTEESSYVIPASWARGFALHYHGRFQASREDHERVIDLYDPEQHSSMVYIFGMDPAVSALSYAGVTSWCLGYPDQAQDHARRALDLARKLNHPSTLAHALTQSAVLAIFRRDADVLSERVEEPETLTTEKGVLLFRAWGVIFRGCVLAQRGQSDEGVARIREGLAAAGATGSRLSHPIALGQLALFCRDAGHLEEGLSHLSDAISLVRQTGEYQYEAELYRLRGELLLTSDDRAGAEASFRCAIDVAHTQEARSWELRATMSLGRLQRATGRADEARQMTGDAYEWFDEGFDSPDLKDARSLLRELSPEGSTSRK